MHVILSICAYFAYWKKFPVYCCDYTLYWCQHGWIWVVFYGIGMLWSHQHSCTNNFANAEQHWLELTEKLEQQGPKKLQEAKRELEDTEANCLPVLARIEERGAANLKAEAQVFSREHTWIWRFYSVELTHIPRDMDPEYLNRAGGSIQDFYAWRKANVRHI